MTPDIHHNSLYPYFSLDYNRAFGAVSGHCDETTLQRHLHTRQHKVMQLPHGMRATLHATLGVVITSPYDNADAEFLCFNRLGSQLIRFTELQFFDPAFLDS